MARMRERDHHLERGCFADRAGREPYRGRYAKDLPPMPLIASTQMHNNTPEKIAFLEHIGFQRVILARELGLEQIRAIRRAARRIELECFVYGALCVGYSGQCLLSYALGGRSGNRGECAQPCRRAYSLVDARGRVLQRNRHLLSLHDLNLSDYLGALIDAGVSALKIEGRLKDKPYVANVVTHFRARLDEELSARYLRRSSSGASSVDFEPDPAKTFNRGFTTYFLLDQRNKVGFPETPKMVGEPVGRVARVTRNRVVVDTALDLHPGDGLSFFDERGVLCGTLVNAVDGNTITVAEARGLRPGVMLHRNHDHAFLAHVRKARMYRRIAVVLQLSKTPDGLALHAEDEDGIRAEVHYKTVPNQGITESTSSTKSTSSTDNLEPARDPEKALATIHRQLAKTGATAFACTDISAQMQPVPFVPVAALNALRRDVLDALTKQRAEHRPRAARAIVKDNTPYPEKELSYLGNVLNRHAEAFYRRHGVTPIEPAAESGLDLQGRKVMTTRYCLKYQLDLCPASGAPALDEPLILLDEQGNWFELHFNCQACEMELRFLGNR